MTAAIFPPVDEGKCPEVYLADERCTRPVGHEGPCRNRRLVWYPVAVREAARRELFGEDRA